LSISAFARLQQLEKKLYNVTKGTYTEGRPRLHPVPVIHPPSKRRPVFFHEEPWARRACAHWEHGGRAFAAIAIAGGFKGSS
ncbi:hypothetical protein DXG01_000767, partial [Tephrocybe rancida]